MEKVYKYKNGIIYIQNLDKINSQNLHNATKSFLEKMIIEKEGNKHGNTNKTRNIREKQILD